jgi:hypothetical protein
MSDSISPRGEHLPAADETSQGQGISEVEQQLLDQLDELWQSHLEHDLEVRHQTGRLLNQHFGSPQVTRQPRGKEILKLAAERLGTNQSDLSRMRWFASHFKDVKDLKERYPGVNNWTKVKELLSTLNPRGNKSGAAKTEGQSAVLRGLGRSLESLSSRLREITQDPGEAERKTFHKKLQEFVEALPSVLQVRLSVEEVRKAEGSARKVTK